MQTLARIIINRGTAWAIVGVVMVLGVVSLLLVQGVQHEDDILAFLPQDNPEVAVFSDINKQFGGLDVALVGIQAEDVLAPGFLHKLRQVTSELKDAKGLDHVLSLANVIDFTPDPGKGGVVTDRLVEGLPKTPEERRRLRQKVMSRDHVVGNLISRDGKAVLIYCYLAYGTDPRGMASRIQAIVNDAFPLNDKFWGGGPFISTYIYDTTQQDMQQLTPWAVLAIVVIMMLSFRDVIGTFLALLSTTIGILLSLGVMGLFGVRFNIVLSSMPVILFAVGSAYGIHVLSRYYALVQSNPPEIAIAKTLTSIGPTVLTAGLTTVAGLLSFVLMDIRPIRTFGIFTALGILFTLLLSLTFIPAVTRLVGFKRPEPKSFVLRKLMVRFSAFARRHRLPVGVLVGAVTAAGVFFTLRVDTRMDNSTFFSKGSPPDRAENFLRDRFGGSQFIQIRVKGEMTDPHVLRELRLLSDRISLLPHVSSVMHVGKVVAMINEILVGQRRIPDNSDQLKLLYAFLTGDPSVSQLVTTDRSQALIHIKVSSNLAAHLDPLLATLERMVQEQVTTRYEVVKVAGGQRAKGRLQELALLRIQAVAHEHKKPLDEGKIAQIKRAIGGWQGLESRIDASQLAMRIERFLRSEECAVELKPGQHKAVALALAGLGPRPAEKTLAQAVTGAIKQAGGEVEVDKTLVDDLVLSVGAPLDEMRREQKAAQVVTRIAPQFSVRRGQLDQRVRKALTNALLDLDNPAGIMAATRGSKGKAIGLQVNGLPVMHRGLSRSVTANQFKSLGFALALIVVIMAIRFRSLWTGLLVGTPTLFTLLVIYGGMGLLGVRLDIGTSMLASLILGAGVDYAVHLASAWHAPAGASLVTAAARAADRTGPAIWTNAIMVFAGFFVLTLGEARPLQNVGGLTAAAMITAAVATFLVIPVLARKRVYSESAGSLENIDSKEIVDAVLGKAHQQ